MPQTILIHISFHFTTTEHCMCSIFTRTLDSFNLSTIWLACLPWSGLYRRRTRRAAGCLLLGTGTKWSIFQ